MGFTPGLHRAGKLVEVLGLLAFGIEMAGKGWQERSHGGHGDLLDRRHFCGGHDRAAAGAGKRPGLFGVLPRAAAGADWVGDRDVPLQRGQ